MPYNPNSLIGRLTKTDNRIRAYLLPRLGIPTIMLVRWNLDGVTTPQFALRVSPIGIPKYEKYLNAAVNSGVTVTEETLLITDIPRQAGTVALSEEVLRYGMIEMSLPATPLIVAERAEVIFLDTSKLTTYNATVQPYRNR